MLQKRLPDLGAWLYRRAENLLAGMLGAMFAAFLLQIVFRYVLNFPIGWTNEISVVLWLWLVLFGAAFVLREEEEIRFDLIYAAVSGRTRRVMVVAAAACLLILYGMSLPATWDYVTFMKVESMAYLKIRFDLLFSIYIVFVLAAIARYLWLAWRALRGDAPGEFDPTKAGSGV
ncbi:TRAP transporter small permease [Arvimicrobium flavum]|uniref:TRAP transporter small permease n=1 Tax=Arvimicrobium flavum TaxID=3393320 RepID=UPI00237B0940|nr:TRAP transporter small permease subunit [Mesorhizobium shangrilense]